LKIPLVTLRESFTLNVFGVVRTYLHCGRDFSLKTLIEAIKNGAATISNGPFLEIKVRDRAGKEYIQGNEVAGSDTINIKAKTNSFFGNIRDIKLIYGDLQNSKEHIFFQDNGKKGSEFEIKKDISELNMGYLRGEVFTEKGKKAFTNPVWIRK
jgi:hypothetical protein